MKNTKSLLTRNIIATIIFYDVLNWPLTSHEIYRYLIKFKGSSPEATYSEIRTLLRSLKKEDLIENDRGFYCLKGRKEIVKERIKKDKQALQKWQLAQKRLSLLMNVPFVRAGFVPGSLGVGNANEQSDIDLLVIVSEDRVWTVRFLLHFIFASLGWRRRGSNTKDKICLYHFLEAGDLELSSKSIYDAQIYAHFLPFYDRGEYTKKFCEQNSWVTNYLDQDFFYPRPPKKTKSTRIQKCFEWILENPLGAGLEQILSALQKFKIKKTPSRGNEYAHIEGGKLAFHPQVREKKLREKYEERIEQFGFLA